MSIAAMSYLSALMSSGSTKDYLRHGRTGHLFRSESDKKMYEFVDQFVRMYGKLPEPETFTAHTKLPLLQPKEPADYYLDLMREGYIEQSIVTTASEAQKFLHGEDKSPSKALDILKAGIADIQVHGMGQQLLDYRESEQMLVAAYSAMWAGEVQGLQFGWPTLDAQSGGLQAGDLVSIVGKTGVGKTWVTLWIAFCMWLQGKTPLFVSMEVKPLPIFQRISAMHAKKPFGEIIKGQLSTYAENQWKGVCSSLAGLPHPFWVVDGNLAANVSDIQALAYQLKPDVILLDGGYLMSHPTEKNRFLRVAENVSLMKQCLCPIAPTVASWQFNSEANKLKKGEQPGIEHIGSSIAIGQLSSLVLAFLEDESIETEHQRAIDVLKGRNGEVAKFYVKWRFDQTTDFSEAEAPSLSELQF